MRRSKADYIEDLIIIIAASVLLIIIIIVAILSFRATAPVQNVPAPSVSPSIPPTVTDRVHKINFDNDAEARLANRINNRPSLAPYDNSVKENMLTTILHGHNSGIVYQSPNVRVEYVESADIFMAEILTTDIQQAKDETNVWFRDQGFRQQAICDLPLMFYLNFDVLNKLSGKNYTFSPVPNSC